MSSQKPSLETYASAILDRDRGLSYSEVLEKYKLVPNQFARAVNIKLNDLIQISSDEDKQTLEQIASDKDRKAELFRMGEEFIQKQYMEIAVNDQKKSQRQLYYGTLAHPENIELLVYFAITYHNPGLASTYRKEVVEGIKSLPYTLKDYFHSIGLTGVMSRTLKKGEIDSPLGLLKVFDRAYQKKTGDVSLFDLSQKEHLHEWGGNITAPHHYWQNPTNVENAVYHILTEHHPRLASENRAQVADGIKNINSLKKDYLRSIGLGALLSHGFRKGEQCSPLAVLKAFDRAYQKKTGDVSLFDLSQEAHLHEWGDNIVTSNHYWKDPARVEKAVYHILTEHHWQLALTKRKEVVRAIENLPDKLAEHFYSIGLRSLMTYAFEKGKRGSPRAVLEVFDRIYQRKTGDVSLFDKDQGYHIEFNRKNMILFLSVG